MTGSEFRKWRRSLEITQQEVADYVGCDKSSICRWESGEIDFVYSRYEKAMKFYEERRNSDE